MSVATHGCDCALWGLRLKWRGVNVIPEEPDTYSPETYTITRTIAAGDNTLLDMSSEDVGKLIVAVGVLPVDTYIVSVTDGVATLSAPAVTDATLEEFTIGGYFIHEIASPADGWHALSVGDVSGLNGLIYSTNPGGGSYGGVEFQWLLPKARVHTLISGNWRRGTDDSIQEAAGPWILSGDEPATDVLTAPLATWTEGDPAITLGLTDLVIKIGPYYEE